MKARLVALAIASLAAVGLQPVQADTFFAYQGAPILEFSKITDGTNPKSNLQPSKGGTRTEHEIDVSVVSNGDPETINRVTFCLYKDSVFEDNSEANDDTTADELCGYANGTGAEPTSPDPKHVAAFTWTGDDYESTEGSWSVEGDNDHEINTTDSNVDTTITEAYEDGDENSLKLNKTTFTFVFALSHATANADDWKVRVSAQTTSLGKNGTEGGDDANADEEQGSAIDSFTPPGEETTAVWDEYGVYFFAAFSADTVRGQKDFGSVLEGGTSTVTDIDTAVYWANDEIDISMIGDDFTSGDDTLSLVTDDPTGTKAVKVTCYPASEDNSYEGALNVPSTETFTVDEEDNNENILLADQGPSGEAPATAELHDCELTYGEGATFGDATYSNTMTLGLLDSNTGDFLTAGLYGLDGVGPSINPED